VESEETWRKLSLDLAWAAGLFDGEGCTSARPYKNRPGSVRIQASVSQSSHSAELVPSVLQRFQRAVGGMGSIGAPFLDKRSGTFTHQWRACDFEETQAVIALLWSNLSPIKRAQGADALDRFRVQYDAIRPRYRTPVRPRRFSLLAPGPAASREEQAFAWAAGLFDGEGSTELYKRRTPGHTCSLCDRVSPSATDKVSPRFCNGSGLSSDAAALTVPHRERATRTRTSGMPALTTP